MNGGRGGGGEGEVGWYNCNIAQVATQLPYAPLCSCQLSIAVIYQKCSFVSILSSKIRSCDACQRVNRKMVISTPQLHPIPVKAPWYHIGIDFIGPVNPTSSQGNRGIF